jgi:alpha-galactosidase
MKKTIIFFLLILTVTVNYLDPEKTYNVKAINGDLITTLTGRDLRTKGFPIIVERQYSGDLFEISLK